MQNILDIIIPIYNEQDNIERVLNQIKEHVKTPYLITVVLQDKNDPTIEILKPLQKKMKNLHIIFTKNGVGMLKALKEGFANTKAPIITIMMGDLSDDAEDIDKMIAKINKGYDLVCASRYYKNGKRIGGPIIKGFLSYLACISLNAVIKLPTHDATNAFKTFKRSLLDEIVIESHEGFEMPIELTVKAFHKHKKITEIPTIWRDRESGKSKFTLWHNMPLYLRWYMYGIINRS